MAGPALDPVKVQQFQAGFNGDPSPQPKQSPQGFAGGLAQALAAKRNGQPAPSPSPQAPGPSEAAMNPHAMAMEQAAQAAKLKYMQENGVDENGDPVAK